MKKSNLIKGGLAFSAFIVAIFITASCNSNVKAEDRKEVAEKQNESKFDTQKKKDDAQFLVDASEVNLKGILLGQLAQERGGSAHVRELGLMLEGEHIKMQKELTLLAKSKSITIPTAPTNVAQEKHTMLKKKSGDDFDIAYADMMVKKHQDVIEVFEDASENCDDEAIKEWAKQSLPVLQKHLKHSIKCQKECVSKV